MKRTYDVSNKELASSKSFVALCEEAGVAPTKRQASKFRNGKGAAYNYKKNNKQQGQ